MIPQSYPLYARMWFPADPSYIWTQAVIGWEPDPTLNAGNYIPVVANMRENGRPSATTLDSIHQRWRIITDPNDEWKPTQGDGLPPALPPQMAADLEKWKQENADNPEHKALAETIRAHKAASQF